MKRLIVATNMLLIISVCSCSAVSEGTRVSLETVSIGFVSETTVNTDIETVETENENIYVDLRTVDDLYIEGNMGDDTIDIELCIKLPRDYSGQRVNTYRVTSTDFLKWEPDTTAIPGWNYVDWGSEYIINGIYESDGKYSYMSDEDVNLLVESFEWKDAETMPGYKEIRFDDKKYCSYAYYCEWPASKHYDFRIDKKKIKKLAEENIGVYSVREELDGLPVGSNFQILVYREKTMNDGQHIAADGGIGLSDLYYNGEDFVYKAFMGYLDYEIEEEGQPVIPLTDVITNAIPAIESTLIPSLRGKRIRVYAAEIAYLPCCLLGDFGSKKTSDGKEFVDFKYVPFWVIYYQTDMSVLGYQREAVVINAITGEAI